MEIKQEHIEDILNVIMEVAKGNYSVQVTLHGENDEYDALAMGINMMVDDTRLYVEQLKEDALLLEKKNEDLNRFAYIVSHDLKAPLRAIVNLSEWLEEDIGKNLNSGAKHNLDLLKKRAYRMEALINGILDYSRAIRIKEMAERTDVQSLLYSILEFISVPQTFTVEIKNNMPFIVTEKIKLQQIFSNLINNAIKHHHGKDGHIVISANMIDNTNYEFSVSDDGPGIAPEYHEKIFIIFQTLESRDKTENTGVGLAIVKKLVEDNGGAIRIESEPGKGTKFIFTWKTL